MEKFKIGLIFIISSLILMVSCSQNNGALSNKNPEPLTANLGDSQKMGLLSSGEVVEVGYLDANGQVLTKKILSASSEVSFVGTTTNSILARGIFLNALWPDGTYDCYLISFSKNARNEQTLCLSKFPVGSFSLSNGGTNAHYSKIGIKQRGNTFYFVSNDRTSTSFLYKWSEGESSATLLYSRTFEGSGFEDLFLDYSGTNICVLAPAITTGNEIFNGRTICGNETSSSWSDISSSLTQPILAETFQLGNLVVSTDQTIDMATLSVSSRVAQGNNGGLPSGFLNQAEDASGGLFTRAYAASLSYVESNGNTNLIADYASSSRYWYSVLGLGNYAWTYGGTDLHNGSQGNSLRRFNFTNKSFEMTEYISQTGLVSIQRLAYNFEGDVVVTGLTADGNNGSAKIDAAGTITILPTYLTDTFSNLINL